MLRTMPALRVRHPSDIMFCRVNWFYRVPNYELQVRNLESQGSFCSAVTKSAARS
jgi:hypothetical protein